MLIQELKTILSLFLVHYLKNNSVSSGCARDNLADYEIFMRSKDAQSKTEESYLLVMQLQYLMA